ncbi:SDR family NAD(P)-dependent oxidoreductase [Pseudonocardia cypriaca]|uniref:NAD(P)-dependent dehydrogenase (Short-subunit alcohol dehydrogenase family) n=1 Tax=Pseudonocardia cypriaca TaxID=882449 RepID=A0A543FT16_9PSEU|nr:SDR family oxidoreductase [Pseudonocardia cypriaca]TQM36988.1 NAD(P)-dependent dehydrogenase (short-subunit alcohol dehydrogenase family) [Pseudonocardia cypriaca]
MDLQLHGTTAFVTGGAQGIGLAIADRLCAEGVRLAVADIDGDLLHKNDERWTVDGRPPLLITVDLSTAEGVASAVESTLAGFDGPPHIVVNNVGVAVSRDFADIDDAGWQRTFDTNFMSYVRVSRALLPRMGGGAVVNIASDLAKQPEVVPADYGAMKAAVLHLTKVLALRYAPAVRTNAVLPGPVWTGLWSRPGGLVDLLAAEYGTDRDTALARYLKDRQLTFGIADPEDVADMVAFLVSPRTGRINGSAFDIGGTVRSLI